MTPRGRYASYPYIPENNPDEPTPTRLGQVLRMSRHPMETTWGARLTVRNVMRYRYAIRSLMIVGFADRETELVWNGIQSRRLPDDVQRTGCASCFISTGL